ncbi:prolyl oligopeptidase family serine peptidase [Streptomyces sp. NPDC029004]|uniref:S9 family peptidase n=1 Tax=Streptomyces sp. NPDC029004 TaxID=3154490 RepID=UPI00340D21A1
MTEPGPASASRVTTHDTKLRRATRYQTYRSELPEVCATDASRMAFTADANGRCEVFTWDAVSGVARQVTDRPHGTLHNAIDRDGHIWWFDEDADGLGRWLFQPFAGGPDIPGLEGVEPGVPRGIGLDDRATVAMAMGTSRGTTVHIGRRGGHARQVTHLYGTVSLAGISPSGANLAVAGSAGSDRAVTVMSPSGLIRAVLRGSRTAHLWARGFSPMADREELLLVQEHRGRYRLAGWRPETGFFAYDWCSFDTEITASWYPDRAQVLIRQDRHGRTLLHRADLEACKVAPVTTPPGSLLAAAARPDGDVHYLWSTTAEPPRMQSTAGTHLPPLGTVAQRVPGQHRDLWTPGPDGPVHTFLSLPDDVVPAPVVFLVHGGPADHDRDAYDGVVHSLVGSGFAVARVNYRGSTGYGPHWRRAYSAGVGLTQVQDLAAVRADLVRRSLVHPDATALWGTSWGGYLTLLALGIDPGLWQAAVAVKPIADCAAAYRTSTPALQALDERLFGGTPDDIPDTYARSSPIHYVSRVRAPLLLVAAERDEKCPPAQVRGYLSALECAGARYEDMWLDTGHDGYVGHDHVAVLRRAITFLDRELRGRRTGSHRPRPQHGER